MRTYIKEFTILISALTFTVSSPVFASQALSCDEVFSMTDLKPPLKKASLSFQEFGIKLKLAKSESPDYSNVVVTMDDGYQSSLIENYGWNENSVQNMDIQIYAALNLETAYVAWEDREKFEIDIPSNTNKDPVQLIRDAMAKLVHNPASSKVIEENESLLLKANQAYKASVAQAKTAHRNDTTLLNEYSAGYDYKKNDGTNGYLIVKASDIRNRKSLDFSEKDLLGNNSSLLKIATSPGTVILNISLSGTSFKKLYGDWTIPKNQLYGGYESKLEQLVRSFDPNGTEIHYLKAKGITTNGNDEHMFVLTTKKISEEVSEKLAEVAKP
ncbi:MAG: hypothetical protein ACXWRE_09760 [Pseudobdellovibrionaceae bacterium]